MAESVSAHLSMYDIKEMRLEAVQVRPILVCIRGAAKGL